jgi:biotin carboxyl carrier protein
MTGYTVTVNGKSYDVLVQKKKVISSTLASEVSGVETAAAPLKPIPVTGSSTAKLAAPAGGDGEKVVAPMPGKIIEMKVRVGDRVKQGQALLIMEAMKMHNPILAAKEGTVAQLFVKVNDPVQSGQSLLAIR